MDYYSDYCELAPLSHSKSAKTIIKHLKHHFSTHGIPVTVQSDNGPPFNSDEFCTFAEEYGFQLTTSSPEYAQSNGKVESAVKIAKTYSSQSYRCRSCTSVLEKYSTEGMNSSTAQRLYSRRTWTQLPTQRSLLKPEIQTDVKSKKELKQKHQFDKGAKRTARTTREIVRLKPRTNTDKRWRKAKVLKKVNIRSWLWIQMVRNIVAIESTWEAAKKISLSKNRD